MRIRCAIFTALFDGVLTGTSHDFARSGNVRGVGSLQCVGHERIDCFVTGKQFSRIERNKMFSHDGFSIDEQDVSL